MKKIMWALAAAGMLLAGCGDSQKCEEGTQGCECLPDGSCTTPGMICREGRCESGLEPPQNPRCYTPCRTDLIRPDGTVVPCSAEGLMEVCLNGMECVDGSCETPGQGGIVLYSTQCTTDWGCPDHQTCIEQKCYSTCAKQDECPSGQDCHRHVCRLPCSTDGAAPCEGADRYCRPGADGQNGYCMPTQSYSTTSGGFSMGGYVISPRYLTFNPAKTAGVFLIVNDHPTPQEFRIKKYEGSRLNPTPGPDWLKMGPAGGLTTQNELVVQVDGYSTLQILLEDADQTTQTSWKGLLMIHNNILGARSVILEYFGGATGQWSGSIYYFGDFDDAGLDDWRNGNQSAPIRNQFVLHWNDFVEGSLNKSEFDAIVASTLNGSWKWESMKAHPQCQGVAACYPYPNTQGFLTYTTNQDAYPIPSGVVEMPVVLNLKDDGAELAGRILSAETLHHVGDPAIAIPFSGTAPPPIGDGPIFKPAARSADGEWIASVLVGGRYTIKDGSAGTAGCQNYAQAGGAGTYTPVEIPWLVPGFDSGTEDLGGRSYRYECRDTLLPFGDAEREALNPGYAAANPIPNGRTLSRVIQVVDGALVDHDEIFLIFKESFDPPPFANSSFSAYGFMRLHRSPAELEDADFIGSNMTETRTFTGDPHPIGCSQELVDAINDKTGLSLSAADPLDADLLANLVVFGRLAGAPDNPLVPDSPAEEEKVHYLCVETGLFDVSDVSAGGEYPRRMPCPETSPVIYFSMRAVAVTDPVVGTCQAPSDCSAGYECRSGLCTLTCTVTGDCPELHVCRVPEDAPAGYSGSSFCYRSDDSVREYLADHACKNSFSAAEIKTNLEIEEEEVDGHDYHSASDAYQASTIVDVERSGNCENKLYELQGGAVDEFSVRLDPVWRCANPEQAYCSEDRLDLKNGKNFYPAGSNQPVLLGIQSETIDAFRYKTRFRNRTGKEVGFAPDICQPSSSAVPYCYDPEKIEELLGRIDCAVHLYVNQKDDLLPATQTALAEFLRADFGYELETVDSSGQPLDPPRAIDGFERLYAQLLIMLGDESYTAAFQSRFDLAGSALNAFEGSRFEEGGIDLSGGAGFEMYTLYQATQYYQSALDRLYSLSPVIWDSLAWIDSAERFITQKTVVAYFDRLIRASTQKTRAWSEIAARYRQLNQGGLARRVVERAYTAAYLESVILTQMMLRLEGVVDASQKPQIRQQVGLAQIGYASALLQMREVYTSLSDAQSIFGFAPDYIPFPAMDPLDINAFEKMLDTAKESLAGAAAKEEIALATTRDFETDAAAFQSELVSIRNNYENRLAGLCGTFAGMDGKIYPAVSKYAEMDPELSAYPGEICGQAGNGEIHEARIGVDAAVLDLRQAGMVIDDLIAEILIEKDRVVDMCDLIEDTAQYVFDVQEEIDALQQNVRAAEMMKDRFTRWEQIITIGDFWWTAIPFELGIVGCEIGIGVRKNQIEEKERSRSKWVMERDCDYARVDSDAKTRTLLLSLDNLQLDYLKAVQNVGRAGSRAQSRYHEAMRLLDEQTESEQMAINVAAARNDPNFRIFKNDAILTADRTFQEARQAAYKATKVYEYYTSQSYAHLIDLFLVRMVSHGDISLEAYLSGLESAFIGFEEQYGNPDLRVEKICLRDDILDTPFLDENHQPYALGERTQMMRDALNDPVRLDENGYIVVPFATRLEDLCPITHNHKIRHIEAQIFGSDLGDPVARIYLRQRGTGTVRGVDGQADFYAFPERTAVINPFVGDSRAFGGGSFQDEVFINRRLRDQPLVNSNWELLINMKDEPANRDLNLGSLDDICLYVYYTDFTEL